MAAPCESFTSRVVPLPAENVGTDQIVPARYLKITDKAGLADALFRDWRFEADGSRKEPAFVLDISSQIDAKLQAIRCYESQFITGRSQAFPTALDDIRESIDELKYYREYFIAK